MLKETVELFKTLNNEMKEFSKAGMPVPNEIKMYQLKINQFYKNNGIKAKNNQFTTRAKLTPDQESELKDLAVGMVNNNDVHFISDYENILESGKFERFGVKDVKSLIKTMDFLKNAEDEEIVKNTLSSSQIIEVFSQANKKGISEDDIMKIIVDKYKKTGFTGSELHEAIYNSIQKSKKTRKPRLEKGFRKTTGNNKKGKGLIQLYGIDED